jgi:hypothetical protein
MISLPFPKGNSDYNKRGSVKSRARRLLVPVLVAVALDLLLWLFVRLAPLKVTVVGAKAALPKGEVRTAPAQRR